MATFARRSQLSCRVYIVLEYIPNVLSVMIQEQRKLTDGGLPHSEIWNVTEQLLRGVRFLHKHKVTGTRSLLLS